MIPLPPWKATLHGKGSHRMATVQLGTIDLTSRALGKPNGDDDPYKVRASWEGIVTLPNGRSHAVALWDWKGSADDGWYSLWSDDAAALEEIKTTLMRVYSEAL